MVRRNLGRLLLALASASTLAACASAESPRLRTQASVSPAAATRPAILSNTPVPNPPERRASRKIEETSSVARALGVYKVGKPYQVAGVWYVPAEQPDYDAVGTASWYGDAFHGKPTANGEAFDMHMVSAAHATLPLPSIVEVTNLDNDRSIQVRINDRGPFKPGRIIDVSRAAADQLGFVRQGTAKVRVRYVGPAPKDSFLPRPERKRPLLVAASKPEPKPELKAEAPLAPSAESMASEAGPTFAVQAGSFANKGNAERAARALGAIAPAEVREQQREGGVLYRVLVGAWPGKDGAADALAAVAEAGFPDARVVTSS